MKKIRQTQILLISIGLLLILLTYFYYPYLKRTELTKELPTQKDLGEETDDETEESSDFCPSEINGENMDEVDDACIATFDEDEETESSESKDSTLSGFLITSTIGLIAILAFTRRRFRV